MNLHLVLICFFISLVGCVKYDETNRTDSASDGSKDCVGVSCEAAQRVAKLGVLKQSQIFVAFRDGLGLTNSQVSEETKNIFKEIRTNISSEGDMGGYSAPMQMAITQMAGSFCQDLINHEATLPEPVRLRGFDLTPDGTGTPDIAQLKPVIERLARATWGKVPREGSIDLIAKKFQDSPTLTGTMNRPGALFICSLTLSSPLVAFY